MWIEPSDGCADHDGAAAMNNKKLVDVIGNQIQGRCGQVTTEPTPAGIAATFSLVTFLPRAMHLQEHAGAATWRSKPRLIQVPASGSGSWWQALHWRGSSRLLLDGSSW
jgi:hypothetical protein